MLYFVKNILIPVLIVCFLYFFESMQNVLQMLNVGTENLSDNLEGLLNDEVNIFSDTLIGSLGDVVGDKLNGVVDNFGDTLTDALENAVDSNLNDVLDNFGDTLTGALENVVDVFFIKGGGFFPPI